MPESVSRNSTRGTRPIEAVRASRVLAPPENSGGPIVIVTPTSPPAPRLSDSPSSPALNRQRGQWPRGPVSSPPQSWHFSRPVIVGTSPRNAFSLPIPPPKASGHRTDVQPEKNARSCSQSGEQVADFALDRSLVGFVERGGDLLRSRAP